MWQDRMKFTMVFLRQPMSDLSKSRAVRLRDCNLEASLWACLM